MRFECSEVFSFTVSFLKFIFRFIRVLFVLFICIFVFWTIVFFCLVFFYVVDIVCYDMLCFGFWVIVIDKSFYFVDSIF